MDDALVENTKLRAENAKLRAENAIVFRQVRINSPLGIGMALGAIPQAVSSWTTSREIAQRFREKDHDRSKVMIIFARCPAPHDVILNLNAIYADPDLMDTVSATEARLTTQFHGIKTWRGTQQEVVLKEATIDNDEIVSLGAFRQLSDAVPMIGNREPGAPSEDQIFRELTGRGVDEHFWTSREGAAEGVRNAAERTRVFLVAKRLWPSKC